MKYVMMAAICLIMPCSGMCVFDPLRSLMVVPSMKHDIKGAIAAACLLSVSESTAEGSLLGVHWNIKVCQYDESNWRVGIQGNISPYIKGKLTQALQEGKGQSHSFTGYRDFQLAESEEDIELFITR